MNDFLASELGSAAIEADEDSPTALYTWADSVLRKLEGRYGGRSKLVLAELLGLLSDTSWTTCVGIELPGSTPRHRVIARFAKENLWKSIWSLNWDTILESALERVGLERGKGPANQGWPTAFATNILRDDFVTNADEHIVEVCKPHGCVYSLVEARNFENTGDLLRAERLIARLMIGAEELAANRTNEHDDAFFDRLRDHLRTAPLMAVGWRATELSLKRAVAAAVDSSSAAETGALTIIDPVFNLEGHRHLAGIYGIDVDKVHCQVDAEGSTSCDELFLWLQARYALQNLLGWACEAWKAEIQTRIDETRDGALPPFAASFTDSFLPAWVRLCWRAGIIDLPPGNQPEMLNLEKPDHHVPLSGPQTTRRDLRAAAGIPSLFRGKEDQWNLTRFPGCFWHSESQRLVVPMPAWGDPESINDLRAIRALLRNVQQNGTGLIKSAALLPLRCSPTDTDNPDLIGSYKVILASCARTSSLANPNAWPVIQDLN